MSAAGAIVAFWRTRLGVAIVAYLTSAFALLVASVPFGVAANHLSHVAWTLVVLLAPAFLVATLVAVGRSWRTAWPAPPVLIAGAVAFVAASEPLMDVSARLMFQLERPVYERIVADMNAGRLPITPPGGTTRRYGERYFYSGEGIVTFDTWAASNALFFEVFYDAESCPGRHGGRARHYKSPGGMLMISSGYRLHLDAHYCLRMMIA